MHHAKQDILALILSIVGLGVTVAIFDFFPDTIDTPRDLRPPSFQLRSPGMRLARACLACHDMTRERKLSRNGPPLWGILDQPAGSATGFPYSPAFLEMAGTGLPWNEETLDLFLNRPHPVASEPGSAFPGIENDGERAALIDYLTTLRDRFTPAPIKAELRSQTHSGPDTREARIKRGRGVAEACRACHDLSRDKKNVIGPYLWNIVGRQAGAIDDFVYSASFLEKTGSEWRWTPFHLDRFLSDPRGVIPETRMLFAGIKDPQRRADLIAYLQTLQ
ncbi:MAG: hypothetical protein HQL96_16870 [Magnetococcales bacterium]|nr:hypothetical protein [Magnetococcales bacterium]